MNKNKQNSKKDKLNHQDSMFIEQFLVVDQENTTILNLTNFIKLHKENF